MILTKKRLYSREEPSRDAKLIIVYCEGKEREDLYFNYFAEISSKIRLEIEPPSQHDNTSPLGLYDKAVSQIVKSNENNNPKYELSDSDEVWFVIDTDEWGSKIDELRENCKNHKNWLISQSNPCFEVWLFYHFLPFEEFENMNISKKWKPFLNQKVSGGFDSRKHPVFIDNAIKNAKSKFEENISVGSTEVFKLAESFYPLVENKIKDALQKIDSL